MTRYWGVVGFILAFFLSGFLLVEALELPVLSDPSDTLQQAGALAALLAVVLLVVDVVVPVPSSMVMVALGALYGPVLGALLCLLGRVGMVLVGFAIGRVGGPALDRLVPPRGRIRADLLLERWGVMALVISRPVPLLAETVAILAGASSIGWRRAALAAIVGSTPEAVVLALSGAIARDMEQATLIWAALLLFAGVAWALGRRAERNKHSASTIVSRSA